MKILGGVLGALLLGLILSGQSLDVSLSCERLARLALPNAAITVAETVEAGSFSLPNATAATNEGFRKLPSFCRVAATLKPSNDSDIKMEVWMPATGWNGKFQAVDNGGFAGTINYSRDEQHSLTAALALGYATASTDTGHVGRGASWAPGHPEKVVDFGWRAVHEMTTVSKQVIASYYGRGPSLSYWHGCSSGGRQGLKEAQRFPDDFDGIIAGAPAFDFTAHFAQAMRVAKVLEATEAARLPQAQRQLLHGAVVAACDAIDGVKDGLIENPQRCQFDPGVLECTGSNTSGCLSAAQVESARLIYASAINPRTKREITGLAPGSELGWTDLGWTAATRITNGLSHFQFIVFGDPNWNLQRFNFDSDIVRAEEIDNDTANALDPNLKPFFDRGGKLIHYHGWSDPQISPGNSTQYYTRVLEALGGAANVHGSYRLFMAPGMAHCRGGEGPNTFDMLTALEQWVEQGKAPDQIIASHSANSIVDRTRPLCPYPQVAAYKGTGSTDDAANFACKAP